MRVRIRQPSPNKQELLRIQRSCDKMPCIQEQNRWNCDKCRVSDRYEVLTGVRLENLDSEIFDFKQNEVEERWQEVRNR